MIIPLECTLVLATISSRLLLLKGSQVIAYSFGKGHDRRLGATDS